jgi:Mg2+ and Co2+ transporter CorA
LRNDAMYDDVRDEIREMSHYLDSDSQRRQSNTVVRLTVITILGLIATVTTGYFGMNIIAFGEGPILERALHGLVATVGVHRPGAVCRCQARSACPISWKPCRTKN